MNPRRRRRGVTVFITRPLSGFSEESGFPDIEGEVGKEGGPYVQPAVRHDAPYPGKDAEGGRERDTVRAGLGMSALDGIVESEEERVSVIE